MMMMTMVQKLNSYLGVHDNIGARIDQTRPVRPGGSGHERLPSGRHRRREADRRRFREGRPARGGQAAVRKREAVSRNGGADGGRLGVSLDEGGEDEDEREEHG